ncbi:MAG: hypothetical protein JO038_05670 [Alphaproteobacteria bacterium]|nr:hypothetical protein [Alphaproteobacteria bacterium]
MTGGHKETDDHPVAVSALSRKRAEIAGIILDLEKQIVAHRADLLHIDNALRLLNAPVPGSAIPPKRVRPRQQGYFVHGELSRRIFDALRRNETVSAAELTETAMRDKGLGDDKEIRQLFWRRFLVRLDQMAARGHIERIGSGQGVRWQLKS